MRGSADRKRRPAWLAGAFALLVAVALVAGIAGGLVRAGVALPPASWLAPAVTAHAFLMICAFMGTVVGLERAVAVKHPLCFIGPLASGAAGVLVLAGAAVAAAWLAVLASLAFVAVNVVVVKRKRADHTALLLLAALSWAAGCAVYAWNPASASAVPLWLSFLILTIAAERLEMTRLTRRRAAASRALYAIVALLLAGAAASQSAPVAGGMLYGAALLALSAWLVAFDIARRTVRAEGLSRYMAVCLLLGYAWLGLGGLAWAATSLGLPWRDAALHALALGFVFSMMLGHAPVILPALARVKVLFGPAFYLPLVLLHGSLVLRLAGGHSDSTQLARGAALNAVAIAAFAATVAASALAWRARHAPRPSRTPST